MVSTPEEGLSLLTGAGWQLASYPLPHANDTSWSADGRRLAFTGLDANGGTDIYTLHSGSAPRPLTGQQASFNPVWSADGKRIAFTEVTTVQGAVASGMWIIHASGGGIRPLTALTAGVSDTPGSFDPSQDGSHSPMPSGTGTGGRVSPRYLRGVDDGRRRRRPAVAGSRERDAGVVPRRPVDRVLVDSRSCRSAAIGDGITGWIDQLYVMRADGSHQQRLLRTATDDSNPSWAPGGAVIAYQTTGTRLDSWSYVDLVNADGSCRRTLPLSGTGMSTGYTSPAWRPGPAVQPLIC